MPGLLTDAPPLPRIVLMSPSHELDPKELMAEARRRADELRASGELPDDIDDRLADDYSRSLRRDTTRSPIELHSVFAELRNNPEIVMPAVADEGAGRGPLVQRIAGRFVRTQLERLASQTDELRRLVTIALGDLRAQTAATFEAMSEETDRLRRLADDAVATADMLADRVTELERRLSIDDDTTPGTDSSDDQHS